MHDIFMTAVSSRKAKGTDKGEGISPLLIMFYSFKTKGESEVN